MTNPAPPSPRPAHTYDAATVLALSKFDISALERLPDDAVNWSAGGVQFSLGDVRAIQRDCGLRPIGEAAGKVVRDLRMADLLALSRAGQRIVGLSIAAYYATDRDDAECAATKVREALAALDRANEIAKRLAS